MTFVHPVVDIAGALPMRVWAYGQACGRKAVLQMECSIAETIHLNQVRKRKAK